MERSTSTRRWLTRGIAAVLGVLAASVLIVESGRDEVVTAVVRALPWAPWIVSLELLRIGCEIWLTARLARPARIPLAVLTRAQLVAYALQTLLPAGRAAGEIAKAAMFVGRLSTTRATAVAASCQAVSLLGNAIAMVFVGGVIATLVGPGAPVVWALFAVAAGSAGLSVAIRALASSERARHWVSTRFSSWLGAAPHPADEPAPAVDAGSLTISLAGRVTSIAALGIVAVACGAPRSPATPFIVYGLHCVGSALGDFVPAQLGATEVALRAGAPDLGTTAAAAVSVALVFHAITVALALLLSIVAALWRPGSRTRGTSWIQDLKPSS